jgi:amino acid adenylation domain-containing protein/non-ribosomal peptide synthase protein (TIGR01720 family)
MNAEEFIKQLRNQHGIILSAEGTELKVQGAREQLSAGIVSEIKSKKAEILQFFAQDGNMLDAITPLPDDRPYFEVSSAQSRLFFLQAFDKNSTAYNLPHLLLIKGQCDQKRIIDTFNKIVERHEGFRTMFEVSDGLVRQRILPPYTLRVECRTAKSSEIRQMFQDFVRPFDLTTGRLLRIEIISTGSGEHYLFVDTHHIVSDGFSQGILIRDFAALYEGKKLTPLRVQAKDYAAWQQSKPFQRRAETGRKFWIEEFSTAPPTLDLPTDFSRSPDKRFEGDRISFELTAEQTRGLRELSDSVGATMFMTVLSVYTLLLSKLSSQDDIVVGTVLAGRHHPDIEDVIGMFVNTMPVRNNCESQLTFSTYLHHVRTKTLQCFNHQECSYEEVLKLLPVDRNPARNPLFDCMLAYQNFEDGQLALNGLTVHELKSDVVSAKFDLLLFAYERNGTLEFDLEYAKAIFERSTIGRFVGYFKRIIDQVIANPYSSVGDITLLSKEETKQILVDFNTINGKIEVQETVIARFEKQAKETPHNIAIRFQEQMLSYDEVLNFSHRFASYLLHSGVAPGDVVAIAIDRGIYMIPAIFGILKAGATYLPIDVTYPQARISFLLSDANAKAIVTEGNYLPLFAQEQKKIIDLDRDLPSILASGNQFDVAMNLDSLAYIIYTSGSTGNPKGVMVSHRSLANVIFSLDSIYPLSSDDCYLLKTTYCFDVSVAEIFGWMMNGGSLCVLPPSWEREPLHIIETIATGQITHMNFVPSMFALFVDALRKTGIKKIASLKYIFLAGEALPFELAKRFSNLGTSTQLENIYGPTEGTIYSCRYSTAGFLHAPKIPIGKPLHNVELYILDAGQNVVPACVTGELYIGGAGVALGYLGNEKLTKEKFVTNPFRPGEQMYKTGDLSRWLKDGNIEYLGRKDAQVKVRGFRIELGEIEHQLNQHPAIRESVVVMHADGERKELVAYYASGTVLTSASLRSYLLETLPEYMIPAYFCHLHEMPLTSNGKLDRKRLPSVNFSRENRYEIPTDEEEKLLASIWSSVLGVKEVGVSDNFFSLGGDSIKSIQICSRLRNEGYILTVKDIFTHPEIKRLKGRLLRETRVSEQEAVSGRLALSAIQKWFFNEVRNHQNYFNQSVMLFFRQGLSRAELEKIWKKISDHHDSLRSAFVREGGEIYQVIDAINSYKEINLFEKDLQGVENAHEEISLSSTEIQKSLSYEKGKLVGFGLFHESGGSHLLIVIHHLVIDGVSWRILFEDLEQLVGQLRNGQELTLPMKSDSFMNYREAIALYETSNAFENSKQFWKQQQMQLADAVRIPGEITKKHGRASVTFSLDKSQTSELLAASHAAFGTQVNDMLLTALYEAMKTTFGLESIHIEMETHGRTLPGNQPLDVGRTVGWFTSIYPLLLSGGTDNSLGSTLKHIKEQLRKIPHEGQDYLLWRFGEGSANTLKKAQLCFNYLGQFDTDITSSHFVISEVARAADRPEDSTGWYEWEITGLVHKGQLHITISYDRGLYKASQVQDLTSKYHETLCDLIAYCVSRTERILTPHDLTYKGLSIAQLDSLQQKYKIEDVYTLSPMQAGMLYHALLEGTKDDYCSQTTCTLSGDVDIKCIEQSMNILLDRHASLRTIFLHTGFQPPIQVVRKEQNIEFTFLDIRNQSEHKAVELILSLREAEKHKGFSLESGVLMRLLVIQKSETTFELVWTHHHILMDGWCMNILIDEFLKIYATNLSGLSHNLPSPRRYADYISWLEARDTHASERYWQEYVQGFETIASLPVKSNWSGHGAYDAQFSEFKLDHVLVKQIEQVSRRLGITVNNVMQFAWAVLLARYNRTNDILFGAVVSGRPDELEGVEHMVGLFINTIPVRIAFHEEEAVTDVLTKFQQRFIHAHPHQYHPLSEIQSHSALGKELVDHIVAFENMPIGSGFNATMEAANQKFVISNAAYSVKTNYHLNVTIYPSENYLVRFDYNANKFATETVTSAGRCYENVIKSIISNLDGKIADVTILSADELSAHEAMIRESLRIRTLMPVQDTLAASMAKHAHHVAIEEGDDRFTYKQLDNLARAIDQLLAASSVRSGARIGILCEKRYHTIASIIGILKFGGVFVPIESSMPKARIATMIGQADIDYILADNLATDLMETFRQAGATVLSIPVAPFGAPFPDRIQRTYELSDEVYIYFTSGSTGVPKGVVGRNEGLAHFIDWEIRTFGVDNSFRFSQFTNPGFDVFMRDVLVPLCAGATICVPSSGALDSSREILEWIDRNEINLIHCVPTFFKLFAQHARTPDVCGSLKFVLLAGEKLSGADLRHWYNVFSERVQLVNIYGPTETTLAKGYHLISAKDLVANSIPLSPIEGAQFLVLDNYRRPLPRTAIGEIYIRTPYASHGYLDKSLNEKVFFENVKGSDGLLYKTGDLGRIVEGSLIEIVGRVDQQIKIRGMRVELEEIRNSILSFGRISDAVVLARHSEDGDANLCAYYVSDTVLNNGELTHYLKGILPDYMVPLFFVALEKMPVNRNGKLDRNALPDPLTQIASNFATLTPAEGKMRSIWSEILNLDIHRVDPDKSFFELGGHSVKIFHLINKIHDTFSVKLKLGDLFTNNSVRALSRYVHTLAFAERSAILRLEEKPFYDASPAQSRIYFQYLLNKRSLLFNIPLVIELDSTVDHSRLENALKKLIEKHETLRSIFRLADNGVQQQIIENYSWSLEVIPLQASVGDALKIFVRPFDLETTGLFRAAAYTHHQLQYLFIDVHHIAADGLALNTLVRDFNFAYEGKALSRNSIRYVDYAGWINAARKEMLREEAYWSRKLSGLLPRLSLPTKTEYVGQSKKAASVVQCRVDGDKFKSSKALMDVLNVSPFMFFVSIQYILLNKLTGDRDIIIGTDVVGRTHPDLKDLVGTFVNVLPLRITVEEEETFGQFVNSVKQCVIDAFNHQDFQYNEMISLFRQPGAENPSLIDFHFSFSNTIESGEAPGLFRISSEYNNATGLAHYPMQVEAHDADNSFMFNFKYDTSMYDEDIVQLLISYFMNILSAVVDNHTIQIDAIALDADPKVAF